MLSYFAFENAINKRHQIVQKDDILTASRRYSASRLKDLGDEFAENYSNIRVVLGYFYGLSKEFTLNVLDEFIRRLLSEPKVSKHCCEWIHQYSATHQFAELLFEIGFMGIRKGSSVIYRDQQLESSRFPSIYGNTTFIIHGTYRSALALSDNLLNTLPETIKLREEGILEELPTGISFDNYKEKLKLILADLQSLPEGKENAERFEEIVGNIIKLCFFRGLTNIKPKERSVDGRTIKDWIASSQAGEGFWARIREKHGATQIIWECKNYSRLSADDFHQAAYYMNGVMGKFSIIAFRGREIPKHCLLHQSRIANNNDSGVVLVLKQNDLEVFLRQAIRGSPKEAHISEIYDWTVRNMALLGFTCDQLS